MRRLTPKQKRFVEEYLIDLNATQAAIRAGYSQRTADRIGPELLGKTCISEAIQAAIAARSARTEVTQDRVIQELARIAFSDIRKLFKPDGGMIPPAELDDETAAAIAGLEIITNEEGNLVFQTRKVKLWDKRGALELLGKHLKLFTDKTEHSGEITLNVVTGISRAPNED